mgnify:CR=1 FL=1
MALSLWAFREANSGQPPVGYTGAPGDNGTCASCHSGGSGSPTLTLVQNGGGAFTTYTPGGPAVTLQVSVSHPAASKYGFQLTVLDANNANSPNQTLSTSDPNATLQTGSGGRKYISHQNASAVNTWTFSWTPPATNVGSLTWYIAANAANGNGTNSGDAIGTLQVTIQPDASAGLVSASTEKRPVRWGGQALWLEAPAQEATLYTLEGREVAHYTGEGAHGLAVPPGLYLLRWKGQDREGTLRLFIP